MPTPNSPIWHPYVEAVAMVEAEAVEGLVMYILVAPLIIHVVKLSVVASKFGNSNYNNMVFIIVT